MIELFLTQSIPWANCFKHNKSRDHTVFKQLHTHKLIAQTGNYQLPLKHAQTKKAHFH